jgi:hypothetical protein
LDEMRDKAEEAVAAGKHLVQANPELSTPHPTPRNPHPKLSTLNPEPQNLNPDPISCRPPHAGDGEPSLTSIEEAGCGGTSPRLLPGELPTLLGGCDGLQLGPPKLGRRRLLHPARCGHSLPHSARLWTRRHNMEGTAKPMAAISPFAQSPDSRNGQARLVQRPCLPTRPLEPFHERARCPPMVGVLNI